MNKEISQPEEQPQGGGISQPEQRPPRGSRRTKALRLSDTDKNKLQNGDQPPVQSKPEDITPWARAVIDHALRILAADEQARWQNRDRHKHNSEQ